MKLFRVIAAMLFLSVAVSAGAAGRPEKVVYHISDASNAMQALGNIRNHLNASPNASIVVVTHGAGIDFLLEDAKDKNGNPFDAVVQELANRKVQFRICNNTLEGRKIDRKRVMPEATVVPSGVAELARLQSQEGYAYIKP
ncbi:DsrE family protein [Massilia sp. X63]|uniref:DsrE family protein n=1 Tax=Massilia sp. X63 TaxID=3237285 RepID=UPI0034DCE700